MLQRRDKTVLRKCGRMIERLWRHLQLRQRCHVLRARGEGQRPRLAPGNRGRETYKRDPPSALRAEADPQQQQRPHKTGFDSFAPYSSAPSLTN
jgi:hypothetical protein